MDVQAATLLSTLKRPAASSESKLNLLNALKSDIKHYRVPETAQATIFECLKLAITQQASSTLASSAFSTLGHLIKRLKIQDGSGQAITQLAPRLFPALHDRLGDTREAIRTSASAALLELYPFLAKDIEPMVRDDAIGGSNPRAKQAGMQWILRMHQEENMPFKSYVQSIVACLEDSDGGVRDMAKNIVIELFSNAPDRAKTDLKRQLKAFSVRHSIESQILAQIGSTGSTNSRPQTSAQPEPETDKATSSRSLPTLDHVTHFAETINSEAAQPPPAETVQMDPIFVHSKPELEDIFREMLPCFEGKETEQNWTPRDKSILKLRRITKGNAPSEFHSIYMAGIKSLVEGILKVANSLRTTMSSNGCQLVQELARTLGPALDPHVEMFLQSFIKMSAATKHIAAENGKGTTDAIFQNCSYHARMMQHVWNAAQEKNVQTRQCVSDWLKTILRRQSSYKTHFESSGGLDLAEKCIKKGLDDANPKVKEGMRAAYWTFAKSWPEKAEAIMSKLDAKSKTALERDSNNPHAALHTSHGSLIAPSSRPTGASSRNTLRELMAEQRKAKAAGILPDRPSSAMAQLSPAKPRTATNGTSRAGPSNLSHVSRADTRVTSTTSTASSVTATPSEATAAAKKGNSLMSGPVRRPRRPEIARPQTADPYASKRPLRPETPADNTPLNSPPRGTGASKTSIPTSSAVRNRTKTPGRGPGSPAGSPAPQSPRLVHAHPMPSHMQHSSRPTSKGSDTAPGEDDFTMVMPKGTVATGRGGFVSGHKRPGQTMSADSGVPALTEEDGFTMVIPDLRRSQQRAPSPLAYRSPLKAMFEEAREKIESQFPPQEERVKPSGSEDRAGTPRSGSPGKAAPQEDVQIYEDPFVAGAAGAPTDRERHVLGELPVNENVRMHSPAQSNGSSGSPMGSPRHAIADARSPAVSSAQDRAEVLRTRRLLGSGIERIRAKTLDAHGFRRMQEIVKSDLDIWEGGKRFDELMGVLLEHLRTPEGEARETAPPPPPPPPPHKAAGLKAQSLGLVRALMTLHKKAAGEWHAAVLTTVLACRDTVDANGHVAADLEKTADEVARQAAPDRCIDAVVDALPSLRPAPLSAAMALRVLRRLLDAARRRALPLGQERQVRLVRAAARHLDDADAEVRKADVELASELFEAFGATGRTAAFWDEFRGTDEGRLGLLTYYIARKGKATATAEAR